MVEKELVITHLQIIHTWAEFARERDLQFFTSKHLEDIAQWSDDAINLLKEQEARVLTLDEAVDGTQVYYVEFQYHLDRGWVKCDFDRMYVDGEVAMLFLRNKTFYQQREDYGQLWRLWDKQPTEEQMKAVKWE